jgi:ADP-heptose:LPS heptosyltransferase
MDEQLRFFPAINQIKSTFEQADIAVVADPSAKDIYQLSKLVSAVIPYSFQTQNSPADWANLLGIMRDREFEVVITLTQSWSMGLLLWLSGVPTRVGYTSSANNLFLTDTVALKPEQPVVHQYQDLLQLINVTAPIPPPEINVPQGDITTIDAQRQGNGLTEGYVLVYPGTTSNGESYGVDGWVTILKDFQQRQPNLPVVLAKTADSAEAVAAIERQMPGITVLEPENPGQMAALVAGANLLVTVNSYPLYLATALKVYTVGLFTQEEPEKLLLTDGDEESRTLAIPSSDGTLSTISPELILKKIWNEA